MNNKTITVKGIGKLSVKPDLTILTFDLETIDMDYETSMSKASKEIEMLRNAIISVGFEKNDLKTTDFNVGTKYETEYYGSERRQSKQVFKGYECSHSLKLEFDIDMDKLNKAISSIASCGSMPKFDIRFSLKDKDNISEQVLKKAVENAKKKAETMVSALGSTLGEVINIDYNWGEIHLYSQTKYMLAEDVCCSAPLATMDIEPDDIDISDTATIIWAIA